MNYKLELNYVRNSTYIDSFFRGNNALHIAVKEGHLDVIRVLLTESQISAEVTNFKGRNPLHILSNFGQDNAVAIFDLFLECMPTYPLDKTDGDGNTGNDVNAAVTVAQI